LGGKGKKHVIEKHKKDNESKTHVVVENPKAQESYRLKRPRSRGRGGRTGKGGGKVVDEEWRLVNEKF